MNRTKNMILASLMLFSFVSEKLIAGHWKGPKSGNHGGNHGGKGHGGNHGGKGHGCNHGGNQEESAAPGGIEPAAQSMTAGQGGEEND